MQLIDHAVDGLPILNLETHDAPETAGGLDVTVGLRGRDGLLIFVDPVVDETATLSKQMQEIVRLLMIGGIRRGRDGFGVTGGGVCGRCGARRSLTEMCRLRPHGGHAGTTRGALKSTGRGACGG